MNNVACYSYNGFKQIEKGYEQTFLSKNLPFKKKVHLCIGSVFYAVASAIELIAYSIFFVISTCFFCMDTANSAIHLMWSSFDVLCLSLCVLEGSVKLIVHK